LLGAGEFNGLTDLPHDAWEALEKTRKS